MAAKKRRLSAAAILAAEDRPIVDVDVPEWGGEVALRAMSAAAAIDFLEETQTGNAKKTDGMVKIIQQCAVDESGRALFTVEDLEKLREKSLPVLLRLQDAALKLNGLTLVGSEAPAKNG